MKFPSVKKFLTCAGFLALQACMTPPKSNKAKLIEDCGEICTLTRHNINTIIQHPKHKNGRLQLTDTLTHFGPINADEDIFPHGCQREAILEHTRHEEAFVAAGKYLGQLSLEQQQADFKFSYPGIGSHIAVISMFKEMININPDIETIHLFAPELIEGYYLLDAVLIYLNQIQYLTDYEIERFQLEDTVETYMKFKLDGTTITIHYHTDPNRELYIEPGELDNTDLLILHDLGQSGSVEAAKQAVLEVKRNGLGPQLMLGPNKARQLKEAYPVWEEVEYQPEIKVIKDFKRDFLCQHVCATDAIKGQFKLYPPDSATMMEIQPNNK